MPNDRITYFECVYNLVNNNAMDDATFTATNYNNYSNLNDLINPKNNYNYMFPIEHNYSVLDGSLDEFSDTFNTPYMTNNMSNQSGAFTTESKITATFTQPQNCFGLTLNFEADYPWEVDIYLTTSDNVVATKKVYPDKKDYVFNEQINDVIEITIKFIQAIPYRYIKLNRLVFGQQLIWGENEINKGNLLLEKDALSDKLAINTLSFDVIDKIDEYNLANAEGLHQYFQKRQEAYAYEYINDTKLFLGKYYLNNFSWDNKLVKLNCVSAVGLLDDVQFIEGDIYTRVYAGTLLENIFNAASITNYSIDDETYYTRLSGTLKPVSCREALRQILFICGSSVRTFGDDSIEIYKTTNYIVDTIYRRNKISTKITKGDYIYGVELKWSHYILNTDELDEIVTEQEYQAGTHTLIFDTAYRNVVIKDVSNETEVTISPIKVRPYYCIFKLDYPTTITIRGNHYEEIENTIQVTDEYLPSGETPTINSYATTLFDGGILDTRPQEILDYCKNRLTIDIKALAYDYELDNRHWVENPNPNYYNFISWYLSRNFDLTGGFIDTAKLQGYYYIDNDLIYANDPVEEYTGEEIGVV